MYNHAVMLNDHKHAFSHIHNHAVILNDQIQAQALQICILNISFTNRIVMSKDALRSWLLSLANETHVTPLRCAFSNFLKH